MATWLKQSTAVDIMLGPFLDETDGKTAETALSITQPDIRLSKNGGAFAQKSAAQTLTHGENGYYPCNLSTTDTGTLGSLFVNVSKTGALPVWREFMVVTANTWDSFMGADFLQVDAREWLGGTIPAVTTTGVPKVDVANWLGTAAATPTVAGVPEVDITHFGGIAGSFSSGRPAVDTTHWQGVSVAIPSVAGVPEVDVTHWNGSAVATPNTAGVPVVDDRVLRTNTATAGAASTITLDAGAPTTVDLFKGAVIALIGGTGAGQARLITAYSAGRVATVTPAWVINPASGTLFEIRGGAADVQAWLTTAPNALASGRVDASAGAIPITLDGKTVEQILQLMAAVLLGKVSGLPGSGVFRSINDTANRVSATSDNDGNRSAVTLNNA